MKRSLAIGILLTLFTAADACAFDGDEHIQISTAALKAAAAVVRAVGNVKRDVDAALAGPPTFGQITEAVDWFENPNDFLNQQDIARAIRTRSRNWFEKGRAAHYNTAHFQEGALQGWQQYHQAALSSTDSRAALRSEAVALHYLEDFFSAGHVVTPRERMHDAVAGHLHDRYNQIGVTFDLLRPLDDEVLSQLVQTGGLKQEDVDALKSAPITFHGDSALNAATNRAQKAFVTAISTLSVAQVLDPNRQGIEPCFEARSAVSDKYKNPIDFQGPHGGVRLASTSSRTATLASSCDGNEWLGRYVAPVFGVNKDDPYYDLQGFTLRSEFAKAKYSRGIRTNLDLLFLMFATDPPKRLVNRNPAIPFTGSKWSEALSFAAAGPSYSHGEGYHAVGLLFDFYIPTPHRSLGWGFRVAPRRYTYAGTHHWKPDVGLKGTFGFDVISLGASVERARQFDTLNRFRPTYFVSAGAEISLNWLWLRHKKVAP